MQAVEHHAEPTGAPATKRRRRNTTAEPEKVATVTFTPESTIFLEVPPDFKLSEAVCSYGYYGLAPNVWQASPDLDEAKGVFYRPLRCRSLGKRVIRTAISLEASPGGGSDSGGGADSARLLPPLLPPQGGKRLLIGLAPAASSEEEVEILRQVQRMLRTDLDLREWHAMHPGAAERGFGRLFRSPTLFEDMVKTITNCNIRWSGTVTQNKQLCAVYGKEGAFPTPEELAVVEIEDLKERGRVGYRADRIIRLANAFVSGAIDPDFLEDPATPREQAYKAVLALHGFGPFAADNVMQLTGRFASFPFDSETVRHFKEVHGINAKTVKEIEKRAKAHYEKFAPFQFIAYWFELWQGYEKRVGMVASAWPIKSLEGL